jgi:Fic family protein
VPFRLTENEPPSIGAELGGVISEAETRVLALNAKALPGLAPLARFLLRTESIASSKVEGMQVDAESLARAEVRRDLGARVGAEALEILANIDAMQLAIEEASAAKTLHLENILRVHRLLLESTRPGSAGKLRDSQNWIGGNDYNPCDADFVPPPPDQVEGLMSDLLDFCNDDSLAPLVQAAIAHAQFETIHPFDDGNGRTGRALVQILLRRRGLAPAYVPPISVVLASDKDRYIRGLTDFREGRDADWFEIFAVATARAADLADGYLTRVSELQEQWRKRLSAHDSPRSDAAAWSVIEALPGYPVLTVAVAATATGRSRPAVEQAIKQLTEAEVLQPVSESQRNRAWEVSELLDLLTEIEEL